MRQACAAAIAADRVNTTINKSKITIQIPKITIQNYNQQIAQNHNQQWNPNPQNPQNYKAWELKREKIPLNRDEQKTSCEREGWILRVREKVFVWEREGGCATARPREKEGSSECEREEGVSLRERESKKGGLSLFFEREEDCETESAREEEGSVLTFVKKCQIKLRWNK